MREVLPWFIVAIKFRLYGMLSIVVGRDRYNDAIESVTAKVESRERKREKKMIEKRLNVDSCGEQSEPTNNNSNGNGNQESKPRRKKGSNKEKLHTTWVGRIESAYPKYSNGIVTVYTEMEREQHKKRKINGNNITVKWSKTKICPVSLPCSNDCFSASFNFR